MGVSATLQVSQDQAIPHMTLAPQTKGNLKLVQVGYIQLTLKGKLTQATPTQQPCMDSRERGWLGRMTPPLLPATTNVQRTTLCLVKMTGPRVAMVEMMSRRSVATNLQLSDKILPLIVVGFLVQPMVTIHQQAALVSPE